MDLKFRAWHMEHKKYYKVIAIEWDNALMGTLDDNNNMEVWHFSEVILEQYTGLKDINGRKIYIGDVVAIKYYYDKRYKVIAKIVEGVTISAPVLLHSDELTNEEIPLYKISANHNLKVIGTIHEDKELIE